MYTLQLGTEPITWAYAGIEIKPVSDLSSEWHDAQQTEPTTLARVIPINFLTSCHILIWFLVRPWFSFLFCFPWDSYLPLFPSHHCPLLCHQILPKIFMTWFILFSPYFSSQEPSFLLCQSRMLSRPSEQLLTWIFFSLLFWIGSIFFLEVLSSLFLVYRSTSLKQLPKWW